MLLFGHSNCHWLRSCASCGLKILAFKTLKTTCKTILFQFDLQTFARFLTLFSEPQETQFGLCWNIILFHVVSHVFPWILELCATLEYPTSVKIAKVQTWRCSCFPDWGQGATCQLSVFKLSERLDNVLREAREAPLFSFGMISCHYVTIHFGGTIPDWCKFAPVLLNSMFTRNWNIFLPGHPDRS